MAYDWLSDPWLQFVGYLCCFLILSIISFLFIIVSKHFKRQAQLQYQIQLEKLLSALSAKQSKDQLIYQLNQLTHRHPLQTLIAWVAVMEQSSINRQAQYASAFHLTDYDAMITRALQSKHIPTQCLAIQMIRLFDLKQYDDILLKLLHSQVLTPYAIAALAKTQGIRAVDLMVKVYEQDYLSNSQLLTAFAELPLPSIKLAINKLQHPKIRALILQYLEIPT